MKVIVLVAAIACVGVARAAPPVTVQFDDLPKLVQGRNEHSRAARKSVEAFSARTGHLTRSFLPELKGVIGGENFRTAGESFRSQPYGEVVAELNLFRGGKDRLEERIRETRLAQAETEAQGVGIEELSKARRSYWLLVHQRELAALIDDSMKQNEANLSAAQRRVSAGMGSETDRIEFEIFKTNLEQDGARVRLEERNQQRALSVLLGHGANGGIETPKAVPHLHEDELLSRTIDTERHREIEILRHQSESSDLLAQQGSRWWMPSLDAYTGVQLYTYREREYPALSDRVDAFVGARLTFSLFDGGVASNEAQAARIDAEVLSTRAIQSRNELAAAFQGAQDELKLLHELVHGAERNVTQSKRYLDTTLSEYRRGAKNSPDVLGASQRYLDSLRRSAQLRRDFHLARTELLAVAGN
jgi:outer membrane protein TolC